MALPNFFPRAAQSLNQALRISDLEFLPRRLGESPVALVYDDESLGMANTSDTLHMAANLLARLYPKIAVLHQGFRTEGKTLQEELRKRVHAINPNVELLDAAEGAKAALCLGFASVADGICIGIQSDSWNVEVGVGRPVSVLRGTVPNPFSAATAACFGVAEVFHVVFGDVFPSEPNPSGVRKDHYVLSLLDYTDTPSPEDGFPPVHFEDLSLVGLGAVGNAVVWTLGRIPDLTGRVHVIDHEEVELSNLQRYVLTDQDSVGKPKTEIAKRVLDKTGLEVFAFPQKFGDYVWDHRTGHRFETIAISVDNIPDRLAAQAVLPRLIMNAWTSEEDAGWLGVSRHWFDGPNGCLACVYLPKMKRKSDTELIADATGLDYNIVKKLVVERRPLTKDLLARIAKARGCPESILSEWEGKTLSEFYAKAVCGGMFVKYAPEKSREHELFVPLAHQSALAGVLLAAELVKQALGRVSREDPPEIRLNALFPPPEYMLFPRKKSHDPKCICTDNDYLEVYGEKYDSSNETKITVSPS
jgi:hypothetical protein